MENIDRSLYFVAVQADQAATIVKEEQPQSPAMSKDEAKKLACDKCEFRCNNEGKMARHMKKTHRRVTSCQPIKNEHASSPEPASADNDINTRVECAECHFKCSSADRMTRHIRKTHLGLKSYQCNMCDYSTSNSAMFEEHSNRHRGIKPYKCSHCKYSSVSRKYIKMHENKHAKCAKCSYVAKNRSALNKHIEEKCCDSEGPNKKCMLCNKVFRAQSNLDFHTNTIKKCSQCNEELCRTTYNLHMQKKHPKVVYENKEKKIRFDCKICQWFSSNLKKILLHLIHHPDQDIDSRIDVTPLIRTGILKSG